MLKSKSNLGTFTQKNAEKFCVKKISKKNTALYVHIPFCFSKCDYCDFFSVACKGKIPDSYIDALCSELDFYFQKYQIKNFNTVYIGGGTPSLLNSFQIRKLLEHILSKSKSKPKEITFEANPESITEEKLFTLEKSGVNRISLGIQSLNEKSLQSVSRHCSAKIALEALELVKKNWHGILNLDIIAGLPFLSDEQFLDGLKKIISYNPEHISMYTLTVEEETPLFNKISDGLQFNTDFADRQWLLGFDLLKKNGYFQYEVSNFCKKGFESAHNMTYWKQGDYLGIGSGATGSLWFDKIFSDDFDDFDDFVCTENVAGGFAAAENETDGFSKKIPLEQKSESADLKNFCGLRWTNTKNIDDYIKFWTEDFAATEALALSTEKSLRIEALAVKTEKSLIAAMPREIEKINLKTREFEYIMMGFRTVYGISFKKYKKLFKNLNPYFGNLENRLEKSSVWNDFVSKNYACFKKSIFGKNVCAVLSGKGLLFLNELLLDLLD